MRQGDVAEPQEEEEEDKLHTRPVIRELLVRGAMPEALGHLPATSKHLSDCRSLLHC